jgi:hypothetical protein
MDVTAALAVALPASGHACRYAERAELVIVAQDDGLLRLAARGVSVEVSGQQKISRTRKEKKR